MMAVPLGDLCSYLNGGTPKKSESTYWGGEIPWITSSEIQQGRILPARSTVTQHGIEKSATKLVPAGQLLIVTRTGVGKLAFTPEPLCFSQDITAVNTDEDRLDKHYLAWFLKGQQCYFDRHSRGATIKGITRDALNRLKIPLPPLSEQKRIAGILDAADALRAKRREALVQLDTLLQATFLDMFGDPATNPKGWPLCTVGDVVEWAKDGPHVSPKYSESGIPFLSTRHIRPGEVVWEDLKYIDKDEASRQWRKCKPQFGDILYTKGGTTGLAASVTTKKDFAVWVHVALLRPKQQKVTSVWLETMLNTSYCYAQSQRYTRGIANRDLGLTRMVKINMYLPPLELQQQFADFVSFLREEKLRFNSHLAELDTLFASLQQRAFAGEL